MMGFWFTEGLSFLPIGLGVWTTATMVTTYIMAVLRGDVVPDFPYISDTGDKIPESCVFGQMLNISAFLSLGTMYVRYKQVEAMNQTNSRGVRLLNKVGLWVGLLTSVGLTLVANFQEGNVKTVHFIGAALVFGMGVVYSCLHTAVSYRLYPAYASLRLCRARAAITAVGALAMIIAFGTAMSANYQWATHEHAHDRLHWQPGDPGYAPHVASTISEWIMAIAFLFYFFTFIPDFQLTEMDAVIRLKWEELSETSPLIT
ncbi:PREDICTED: DNA damage-regulated autophagy modulator protein 1-like isoform X1 [Branchiostoma belcheri]|uniref:DNA damage-regulated autophagy modulator protein 1-like isoform X1 n=2 Tax=Branchiostoma belcheri TaxID=7741 RepID=A0A6P5A0K4_BRABE|nr:PREDICTED: DNA damage-regulated autophagy modulator protein 1-like isoform X1 [Branchiostoma belcheri]XP_019639847.1 PREDICTED: DNA damage-regulated autophagy modulator protein 1-like isoform X1 [Branchiostoma belcheri]XP_019639848.1 PREDICTED: DNA damage-regulated autophagy modulator protein 1-like isoform X1 [Branchiostoma belcheri]XP_019639849.1 PREDICTED: DNA damage-regulated autophagy modulator protein 1-like isoform X1 [Branchiostoma belcheri]XP_019639850.1 PREDICTED: DNA damage-regula